MILTRTHLNIRRARARTLLGSPQAMHAAILAGFPPTIDPGRVLWRVDSHDRLKPVLYVLSSSRPDFAHVEEQAGWPSQPTTVSASYSGLLDSLEEGQVWGFRLRANPTHRATINGKKKILAHVTVDQQLGWLHDRATNIGVDIGAKEESTAVLLGREVLRFKRDEAQVTLGTAVFGGVLRVADPALLRSALVSGIGRAKAYGCGLLTLAKP